MIVEPQYFQSDDWLRIRKTQNVVLISGCFTPFGVFELDYVLSARHHGLIICVVNNDISTRKQRSYDFHPERERLKIVDSANAEGYNLLSQMESADIENEISLIKPDIFFKNSKHTLQTLPQKEIDICKELGCQIVFDVRHNHASEFRSNMGKFYNYR